MAGRGEERTHTGRGVLEKIRPIVDVSIRHHLLHSLSRMHLLFDLDGTLTNPFLGITNCIRHALEQMGCNPPPAQDLTWCIGPPLKESFHGLLNTEDPRHAEKAVAHYRERFGSVGLFENEVYPGVRECLETLTSNDYRLSVATSKPHVYAKRILEHFELAHFFQSIDGSELDGTRTHKGELLDFILKRDNLDAASTLMIGDRKHDMIGAQENSVTPLGVLWGYGSREELESNGASTVVESPHHLSAAIEEHRTGGL